MVCKCSETSAANGPAPKPSTSVGITFGADRIVFNCAANAPIGTQWGEAQGKNCYFRGSFAIETNLGTRKPMTKDISLYSHLKTDIKKALVETLRVGNPNDETTSTNTAIILFSGSSNDMNILLDSNHPYFILGMQHSLSANTYWGGLSSYSVDYSDEISEIWLE